MIHYQSERLGRAMFVVSLLVLVLIPPSASAQGLFVFNSESGYSLEPIVVTATRSELGLDRAAANISIVTREDLERFPVRDVAEALRFVPGLFVDFNGGLGNLATASIHGSEARQVTIYIDGIKVNQLANPIADLSQFPLNNVDRVEIYKGAASSAWGSALGGVINIITRPPASGTVIESETEVIAGSNDTFIGGLGVSGSPGSWGYRISGNHTETDGFIDHSEAKRNNAYVNVRKRFSDTAEASLTANYLQGAFDNPLPQLESFYERIDSRRFYQTAQVRIAPIDPLELSLSAWNQRYVSFSNQHLMDAGTTQKGYHYVENTYGSSFHSTYHWNLEHQSTLGWDGEWGRYSFSTIGDDLDSRNMAVYANEVITFGSMTVNAGLRYDDNSEFGSQLNPSGGVVFRIPFWRARLRTQIARGFSAPPLLWLNDPLRGNPDLKPETGVDFEAGFDTFPITGLQIKVNGFWAEVDDLIMFNRDRDRYENVAKARRRGFETRVGADLFWNLGLEAGVTFVDVVDKETDKVVKNIPRRFWDVQLRHTWKNVSQSLTGRRVYYNSSIPETKDRRFIMDYQVRMPLPNMGVIKEIQVFGYVFNVFNTTQLQHPNFPQPDRSFQVGLSWRF